MNGKRWWNYSSLKRYIYEIEINNNAVANFENINKKQMLDEYIMLALRSKGLNVNEFRNMFGDNWLKDKSGYLSQLRDKKFILITDDYIRLTKSGYALCDEILSNIL
jgi:oxygen-independent coproporphyrinogen-3 oxidase